LRFVRLTTDNRRKNNYFLKEPKGCLSPTAMLQSGWRTKNYFLPATSSAEFLHARAIGERLVANGVEANADAA
jgi:hypothetical protein